MVMLDTEFNAYFLMLLLLQRHQRHNFALGCHVKGTPKPSPDSVDVFGNGRRDLENSPLHVPR